MLLKGKTKPLKDAIRQKYVWPGGYAILLLTSDGALLCCDCARKEYRSISHSTRHNLKDGWNVYGIQTSAEINDPETEFCDHCSKAVSEL